MNTDQSPALRRVVFSGPVIPSPTEQIAGPLKRTLHRTTRTRRGFTMVEIIVVVIVIAVLAALIGPRFFGEVGKAKSAVAQQKLKVIEQAVEKFYYEHNRFPTSLNDLVERPSDVAEADWNPMLKAKDLQ